MSIDPNTSQYPNLYIDKLMHYLTGAEMKVLTYAVRRIFGFHKEGYCDRISLSQFEGGNGRSGKNGEPVEYGTGLARPEVEKAVKALEQFGVFIRLAENDKRQNAGALWGLQREEKLIDFEGLRARQEDRKSLGSKRTSKARVAKAEKKGGGMSDIPGGSQYVGHTEGGMSDIPRVVRGTYQGWYVGHTDRKPDQKTRRKPDRKPVSECVPERDEELELAWGSLLQLCGGKETAVAVWELQVYFSEVTKLKRPELDERGRKELEGDWWPHLLAILHDAEGDLETAKTAVLEAQQAMDAAQPPLTCVAPKSMVRMAKGRLATKKRRVNGNAVVIAGSDVVPKGFSGVQRYLQRLGGTDGN